LARAYELMVIYSGDVAIEQVPEKMESVKALLAEHGGAVTEVIDWGRRRLAYPIKRHFEGQYVLAYFESEGAFPNRPVEQTLQIDESVLRYIIVRRED